MDRNSQTKINSRSLESSEDLSEEECPAKRRRKSDDLVAVDDDYVHLLPNKLLCKIFEYCSKLEIARSVLPVCKRWNEIGRNGPLFRGYLKFGPYGKTGEILETVAKSTPLKGLEIHNRKDFGLIVSEACNNGTCVEEVTLKMCSSPPSVFHGDIFDGCSRLKQCCDSVGCLQNLLKGGFITAVHCANMLQSFPKVEKLTLINMAIRSEKFFKDIGSAFRSLTTLTILYCRPGLTSAGLRLITENCTQLSRVSILQKVTHRHVSTEGFVRDWDEAYQDLVQKRGAQLEVLEFDAQLILSGDALPVLLAPTRLPSLHTLSIEHAWQVADDGIVAISGLQSLKHLHLHYCMRLNERTVAMLLAPGKLGGLETLSVPWCCRLTNRCMEIFAKACPRLKKVDLSYCSEITDDGIETLLQRCVDLRYLILLKTNGIRGSSFRMIPQATPNLRDLVVEKNNITKELFLKGTEIRCPALTVSRVDPIVEF